MESLSPPIGPCLFPDCGCQQFWDATMKHTYEVLSGSERSDRCVCEHEIDSHVLCSGATMQGMIQGQSGMLKRSTWSDSRITNDLGKKLSGIRRHKCQRQFRHPSPGNMIPYHSKINAWIKKRGKHPSRSLLRKAIEGAILSRLKSGTRPLSTVMHHVALKKKSVSH